MAVASSSSSSLKGIMSDLSKKELNDKDLNFYESMYHFKKMFPVLDSDVIETVLRSNGGCVDKTIDQLLIISTDLEITQAANSQAATVTSSHLTEQTSAGFFSSLVENDSPPSYTEIMSTKTSQSIDLNNNLQPSSSAYSSSISSSKERTLDDAKSQIFDLSAELINKNEHFFDEEKPKISFEETFKVGLKDKSIINKYNRILIGELSKDFLRVKLTNEQVSKLKSSIKKAKRNEITAIINNKTPENPELSFELRRQLNTFNDQLEFSEDEDVDDWKKNFEMLSHTFEMRRLQIAQDEYIAQLIQNEEFLNELRSDEDFMKTLALESDYSKYKSENSLMHQRDLKMGSADISNAELKSKLKNMGKTSRTKLNNLASSFMSKAKNKYNKTLDQTSTTYTNLFTSFNPLSDSVAYEKPNLNGLTGLSYQPTSSITNSYEIQNLDEEDSYNLERIKAEEAAAIAKCPTKSSNKYKTAYKSFISTIKRNPQSSHTQQGGDSILSQSKLVSVQDQQEKTLPSDLFIFQDNYSYDDKANYK